MASAFLKPKASRLEPVLLAQPNADRRVGRRSGLGDLADLLVAGGGRGDDVVGVVPVQDRADRVGDVGRLQEVIDPGNRQCPRLIRSQRATGDTDQVSLDDDVPRCDRTGRREIDVGTFVSKRGLWHEKRSRVRSSVAGGRGNARNGQLLRTDEFNASCYVIGT